MNHIQVFLMNYIYWYFVRNSFFPNCLRIHDLDLNGNFKLYGRASTCVYKKRKRICLTQYDKKD